MELRADLWLLGAFLPRPRANVFRTLKGSMMKLMKSGTLGLQVQLEASGLGTGIQ